MYAGVETVRRSVDCELVQRDAGFVEADVGNTQFIRRQPVSRARVQYLFCLHAKITVEITVLIREVTRNIYTQYELSTGFRS